MPPPHIRKNLELTTSEKNTLAAYIKHFEKHGAPPSLRYLGELLGFGHTAIRRHLLRLREKGHLTLKPVVTTRLTPSAKGRKAV